MKLRAFWAMVNPENKIAITREEFIEHIDMIKIDLDPIDAGLFYDSVDDMDSGKIRFEDFERSLIEKEAK